MMLLTQFSQLIAFGLSASTLLILLACFRR